MGICAPCDLRAARVAPFLRQAVRFSANLQQSKAKQNENHSTDFKARTRHSSKRNRPTPDRRGATKVFSWRISYSNHHPKEENSVGHNESRWGYSKGEPIIATNSNSIHTHNPQIERNIWRNANFQNTTSCQILCRWLSQTTTAPFTISNTHL